MMWAVEKVMRVRQQLSLGMSLGVIADGLGMLARDVDRAAWVMLGRPDETAVAQLNREWIGHHDKAFGGARCRYCGWFRRLPNPPSPKQIKSSRTRERSDGPEVSSAGR
jgi:hypothetical protein